MKTDETLTGVCGGLLLGTFLYALCGAWPVMIGLGILHSHWSVIPAFGFLAVLVLLWGTDLVSRAAFSH